jgi:hypothetical protein
MLGYKHIIKAIAKLKLRLKSKYPMYGKNHNIFTLNKISKIGILNPMFNKNIK